MPPATILANFVSLFEFFEVSFLLALSVFSLPFTLNWTVPKKKILSGCWLFLSNHYSDALSTATVDKCNRSAIWPTLCLCWYQSFYFSPSSDTAKWSFALKSDKVTIRKLLQQCTVVCMNTITIMLIFCSVLFTGSKSRHFNPPLDPTIQLQRLVAFTWTSEERRWFPRASFVS